jgi:hypothetical protein
MFTTEKSLGELPSSKSREPLPEEITKVSQAIRIGAKLRPQGTAYYFEHGRSCALGAAYEAIYGHPGVECAAGSHRDSSGEMLGVRLGNHFGQPFFNADLDYKIVCKNDSGWTREQIADWLESQGL